MDEWIGCGARQGKNHEKKKSVLLDEIKQLLYCKAFHLSSIFSHASKKTSNQTPL